jgi:hypothetical protein
VPNPKTIRQDGKTYTFFPGRNGKLIAKNDQDDALPAYGEAAKRSKVVPMNAREAWSAATTPKQSPASPTIDQLALRKKRKGVASTLAATRG